MINRLIRDHRNTKESMGSLPSRLPIPKLGTQRMYMYAEPTRVRQSGTTLAFIPNENRYVSFLSSNSTTTVNTVTYGVNNSGAILGINNNRFINLPNDGSSVWFLVYWDSTREISEVRPELQEGGLGFTTSGFYDDVVLEVSDNALGGYETVTNREWNTLSSPTDKLYFRLRNTTSTTHQYTITQQAGDKEGFKKPLLVKFK